MTTTALLTLDQLAVLQRYADGQTTEEIAVAFEVQPSSIRKRNMAIRERLGVATTTAAVAQAVALGLITAGHGQDARLYHAQQHLAAAARLLEPLTVRP